LKFISPSPSSPPVKGGENYTPLHPSQEGKIVPSPFAGENNLTVPSPLAGEG